MRRAKPEKRKILPDVRYSSVNLQTMVQHVLKKGKKSLAVGLIYDAMDLIKERTSKNAIDVFVGFCVNGITANQERCRTYAEGSMSIVTVLNPHIGYAKAAEIAKEYLASGKSIKEIVLEKGLLTKEKLEEVFNLYGMTEPGIHK